MNETWKRGLLVAALVLVGLLLDSAQGQVAEASSVGTMVPLADFLAPDGTLRLPRGAYGSFDATGYRMLSGPNEAPRFAPAAGDENWAAGFNAPGMNWPVTALAVDGSGTLYAGGDFSSAGTCSGAAGCRGIARWDGSSWNPLGSGMRGMDSEAVLALAVDGSGTVYAGGWFNRAGTCDSAAGCNYIARWDGSTWSALGSGMNHAVYALAVDDSGAVYAGGRFTSAGTCSSAAGCNHIARWDGSSWSALGSGMNTHVHALVVDGSGTVYAGGEFTRAGTCTGATGCNRIARWVGSTWSALGTGVNNIVRALAVDGSGNLYAGGTFNRAGTCDSAAGCNRIARWNGSSWSALATGMNHDVHALAVAGTGTVYAGGEFTRAGACTGAAGCNYIARWNGSSWSAPGSGMDGGVAALAVAGSNVYAGGHFASAAGTAATFIARWNGSAWNALATGNGMNHNVGALAVDGTGNLYAGGNFTSAGTCTGAAGCNRIARWNGSTWSPLGSGISGVGALAVDGSGNLYAGGNFTSAGTCTSAAGCNRITRWNGSTWSALGTGMNDIVLTLAVDGSGNLYAGGIFTSAGTCDSTAGCNYIARWNGSTWSPLGSGMDGSVYALAADGSGTVYAGGGFTHAGTCDSAAGCNNIARWDGSTWSPLGSGMDGGVYALAADGSGNLYAGGIFTSAGTCDSTAGCNYIARWNGSTWSPLGSGTDDNVGALAVVGSNVYAGGYFTSAGTCNSAAGCNHIARWDGSRWSALGSGMNSDVWGLAGVGSTVYAAGPFTQAGDKASSYIAQWDEPLAGTPTPTVVSTATRTPVPPSNTPTRTAVAPTRTRTPVPPTRTPTPANNCTYGHGYWKNHATAWPVQTLQLGNRTYTQSELLTLLSTPPRGDATYILVRQLIAAKLNVAQGANPSSIAGTLTAADTWLVTNPIGSNPRGAARAQGIGYANTLADYNNGRIGPGPCSDIPMASGTPEPASALRLGAVAAQPEPAAGAWPGLALLGGLLAAASSLWRRRL